MTERLLIAEQPSVSSLLSSALGRAMPGVVGA